MQRTPGPAFALVAGGQSLVRRGRVRRTRCLPPSLDTGSWLPGVAGPDGPLGGVEATWLFGRMLVFDAFSVFFKLLLGLSLLAAVWMSLRSPEVRGRPGAKEARP